jgi:hypothetical protein
MSRSSFTLLFIALPLLFSLLGQTGSCRNKEKAMNTAPLERLGRLANGVWGGQHIRMEVTENGAQIEYDCARSTINEPIVLDRAGRFDVKGRFIREHGGPIRSDEEPSTAAARYVGAVQDQKLTLTITNTESGETLGSFTLTKGNEGRLMKCR